MRELKIFSGQANRPLAKAICNFLHLPLGEVTLGKFPDGETFARSKKTFAAGTCTSFSRPARQSMTTWWSC